MKTRQKNIALIPHEFNHVKIAQRETDGYIHATAACKACGKKLNHYLDNNSTQDFLTELSRSTGIPVDENSVAGIPATETEFPKKGLIDKVQGGIPWLQGTWVHPYVAVNLAQWANPKFAVQVSLWVVEWMTTGQNPISQSEAQHVPQPYVTFTYTQDEAMDDVRKDRARLYRRIARLEQTIDRRDELIDLYKTEIERLKSEPEHRLRVTPEETDQIVEMKAAGYSTRQIADAVGRNIETVRTVLYREQNRQNSS